MIQRNRQRPTCRNPSVDSGLVDRKARIWQGPLSLCGHRRGDHTPGLIPAATVAGISGRHLARPAGQGVAAGFPSSSPVAASAARIFSIATS